MKKGFLLSIFFFAISFFALAQAPCNQVAFTQSFIGNTATFISTMPAGYNITNYNWSFGDGGTSNVAKPTHTYANFGWYNACLVVSGTYNNQYVSCTYCDSVFVPNNVPCNASFIYTPSGNTVAFTNTATGPGVITNYAWNFGDGNQSNLPNPTHTYANSGWYNACLTIYGIDNGITYTCTWCDSILVQVGGGNPCNQITFANLIAGNNVNFSVVLPGGFNATNYSWMFGDGGTSNLPNPLHTYNNTGWYNACVVVSGTYNNTPVSCTFCDRIFVLNAPRIKELKNN